MKLLKGTGCLVYVIGAAITGAATYAEFSGQRDISRAHRVVGAALVALTWPVLVPAAVASSVNQEHLSRQRGRRLRPVA